jgi:hypothetical protein
MRVRRLLLKDAAGWTIDPAKCHGGFCLSGIPNANSTMPLQVVVEEQCDLLHWHQLNSVELPCWGSD